MEYSQQEFTICNRFDFDDTAYREVFIHSFLNIGAKMLLSWSKVGCIGGMFVFVFFWILLLGATSQNLDMGRREIALLVFFLALSIAGMVQPIYANWRFKTPPKNSTFVSMYHDFQKMKQGQPFGYASEYKGFNFKKIFSEGKRERELAKWIKDHPEVKEQTYRVPFQAKITDDGIFIGRSEKPFVTDFKKDIREIYESQNYLAVSNSNYEDAIFKKDAFDQGRSDAIKKFLNDKKKGKDVHLKNYLSL